MNNLLEELYRADALYPAAVLMLLFGLAALIFAFSCGVAFAIKKVHQCAHPAEDEHRTFPEGQ